MSTAAQQAVLMSTINEITRKQLLQVRDGETVGATTNRLMRDAGYSYMRALACATELHGAWQR